MRTIYYGYHIVFLSFFWWVNSVESTENVIPLQFLRRDAIEGSLSHVDIPTHDESLKNITFRKLKEKIFIKTQKEKDPEYDDYELKIFVGQKKQSSDIYRETQINLPKYRKVRRWWKKAKERKEKYLTVIFEEKLREADITLVDRIDKKASTYKRSYHFRKRLVDIKDDFLIQRKTHKPAYPILQKDDIEIEYYLMYLDKTLKVDETLTVGQFTRKFYINGHKPLFFLYFSKKTTHPRPLPSPHLPTPKPILSPNISPVPSRSLSPIPNTSSGPSPILSRSPSPIPNTSSSPSLILSRSPISTPQEIERNISQAEPVQEVEAPIYLVSQPTTAQAKSSLSSIPYIISPIFISPIFSLFGYGLFHKTFTKKKKIKSKDKVSIQNA